jgi:hypothetical protein
MFGTLYKVTWKREPGASKFILVHQTFVFSDRRNRVPDRFKVQQDFEGMTYLGQQESR